MVMAGPENSVQNVSVSEFRAESGEAVIFWHKSFLFFTLQLEQSCWLVLSSRKEFVQQGLKCLIVLFEHPLKSLIWMGNIIIT